MKSSPDLEMSIPSAMGQSGHKMAPKTLVKIKTEREGIVKIKNVAHHSVLQESSH